MSLLTAAEIEAGLVRTGVPREVAHRRALELTAAPDSTPIPLATGIDWPVRLTLPWSCLISDNRRHGVIDGKLLLTSDYRRSKGLIRDHARNRLGRVQPATIPLSLTARVWVPDDTRAHDVANFAKATHDALEGVVYTKDRWLYRVLWERAGVDVDAPRADLVILPLLAAA